VKVLFHYDAGPALLREVAQPSGRGLDVVCCPEGPSEPFASEALDAEVMWHVLQPITADVIARAPRLRLIQKIGVGVNTIDLEAARARGIAVCNMPGTNSRAVAEMTLLLMLSALRRQTSLDGACRSGQWFLDQDTKESFGEIGGRCVGFVGFGEVPRILAPVMTALGAEVVYTATSRKTTEYPFLSLEALLKRADIVSLHVPLKANTEHMIDANRLRLMKRGSILVNTARGALVDEAALVEALRNGQLAGAGLDVFAQEPVAADNPLLALDNVTVTPHLAWLTGETFKRSIEIAVHNSLAVQAGGDLRHRVV
jgi:phosphoglycerate dehydrogenase-like enzyme